MTTVIYEAPIDNIIFNEPSSPNFEPFTQKFWKRYVWK